MSGDTLAPTVLWAQRKDKLYVTFEVPDAASEKIKCEEKKVDFSCKSGDVTYAVVLELTAEINPETVKRNGATRNVQLVIEKKEGGEYWDALVPGKKPHFLKIDWNLWTDEDEEADDFGFDNLHDLNQMDTGFGSDSSEADSDDDLPDLDKPEDMPGQEKPEEDLPDLAAPEDKVE